MSELVFSWFDRNHSTILAGELYYNVLAAEGFDSVAVLPMCDAATLAVLVSAMARKGANPLHTKLLVKALTDIADEPIWSDPIVGSNTVSDENPSSVRAADSESLPLLRSAEALPKEGRPSIVSNAASDLVFHPVEVGDGGNVDSAASEVPSAEQGSPGFQRRAGKMATVQANRVATVKSMTDAGRVRKFLNAVRNFPQLF